MDNKTLFTIIVAVSIGFILGIAFLIRFKTVPTEKDKEKAKGFLEELKDSLYKSMIDIVVNFDYKKYDNIADLEMDIITSLQSFGKNKITEKINEALNDKIITSLVSKALNDDTIVKFINEIINKLNIEESIESSFSDLFKQACENNEKSEEELNKTFDSNEFFTDEEVDESMLNPAEETIIPEEELKELNPPREDGEEPYNPNDESMEIIEEISEEENIVKEIKENIYVDANGRIRDKATHKFVKKV